MQVSYGGLEFQIVKTGLYHREPVLSEDKTELLCMRTIYELTMLWNNSATSFTSEGGEIAAVVGADPGETDVAIRYALMVPQQTFVLVSDDGDPLMTVPQAGFDRDPENGPTPISCSASQVGPTTWRVNWKVQVSSIECGTYSGSLPPILSNRWTQSQETGLDRLTRITTRGITVFRADHLANSGHSADFYRSNCIPGLPLGFQRRAISVTVNSAGTALIWQCLDQEVFVSIGGTNDNGRGDVEDFTAVFSMSSSAPDKDGVPTQFLIAQFDASAVGNKGSSRQNMLGWLARLAVERCSIPNGQIDPNTQPLILRVTSSEDLHQPHVELHITMQFPMTKLARQGFGPLRTDFLGIDVIKTFANNGQSPQMPGDNNTRGSSSTLLFAAAIKQACSAPFSPPSGVDTASGSMNDNYQGSPQPDVSVSVSNNAPSTTTNYSDDSTSQGTYTDMRVESRYSTDQGKFHAGLTGPVAKPKSSGSSPPSSGPSGSSGGGSPGPMPQFSSGGPGGGSTSGSPSGSSNSNPPTSVVLTLSRPRTSVEYHFEAERTYATPAIPDPIVNQSSPNLVLLSEKLFPMAVGVAPDGTTPVYRISGVYTYAALQPRNPGESLYFGVHPWTSFNYVDSQNQMQSFVHGIVDPPSSGNSQSGSTGPDN